MSILSGKKVLLGITAGIAAYKATFLVRLLIKAGCQVKVVMTTESKQFVTALTLSTLSKNPVVSSFTNPEDENELWNNHVELALWADLFIIAPVTANTMSKMATGNSDNVLLATYLSAKCPVYFAPAMDLDMYKHKTTKESIEKLKSFGNVIIPAQTGELASGLVGKGRMAEPEDIIHFIENHLIKKSPLHNKKVLITAGPTYEAIDPVRFIGNHSSGKMGFQLAKAAANLGAHVILISGPTHEVIHSNLVSLIKVTSAQDMYNETHKHFKQVDIAILAAAVADYKPKNTSDKKIKKRDAAFILELVPTQDILASLGKIKTKQCLVGFALETNNEKENALKKLKSKNLDLIVLNSLNDKGAGFGVSTNKVTLINKFKEQMTFELKPKAEVAQDIFNEILKLYNA